MVEKNALCMMSLAPAVEDSMRSVSETVSKPRMQSQASGEKLGGKLAAVLMMR